MEEKRMHDVLWVGQGASLCHRKAEPNDSTSRGQQCPLSMNAQAAVDMRGDPKAHSLLKPMPWLQLKFYTQECL